MVTTMGAKDSCCGKRVFLMSFFLATGVVLVVLGLVFRFNVGGIVSYVEEMEVDKVSVKDCFISVHETLRSMFDNILKIKERSRVLP